MKYQIGGFSNVLSAQGRNNFSTAPSLQIGRVYGVVTTENTPSERMFKKAGGFNGIGSIFYLDYNSAKNITGTGDEFLDICDIAKPMSPQFQYYPVLGELVTLANAPAPDTQLSLSNATNQKYYTSIINLWNNNQQNSQPADSSDNLGITFVENENIKSLLSFEGDHVIQGRQGNALRFSSTTKLYNDLNEWSNVGNDDSPITILSNGFAYNPKEKFHVEKINQDASSIYLTTTQQIPLQTDRTGTLNPLTKPIDVSKYFNSQLILNSDRVVLNSKRDEIMIFAKTNIELNTKNIINLNASERVHLNSNTVFLGTVNNNLPTEPLVLGDKLNTLLENLLDSLYSFGTALSSVVGSPEGAPAIDINMAAEGLLNDIDRMNDSLEGILSQQNFTA
jgi:hypothetical protein